jgi:hypothetical protein
MYICIRILSVRSDVVFLDSLGETEETHLKPQSSSHVTKSRFEQVFLPNPSCRGVVASAQDVQNDINKHKRTLCVLSRLGNTQNRAETRKVELAADTIYNMAKCALEVTDFVLLFLVGYCTTLPVSRLYSAEWQDGMMNEKVFGSKRSWFN